MREIFKRFLLPLLVTGIILFFFFQGISPAQISRSIGRIPYPHFFLFAALSLTGAWLRTIRYGRLLAGKVKAKEMFLITLVRNCAVDLLPARTAALLFYSYLTKKRGISLEEGGSSFVVSVFYDVAALSLMLSSLLLLQSIDLTGWYIWVALALLFIVSLLLITRLDWLIQKFIETKIFSRFAKMGNFLARVEAYLQEHKSNSERLFLLLVSLGIRLCKYLSVFILFSGIVDMGWQWNHFAIFCVGLAGAEMSAMLPVQGIAGFGTWELAFASFFSLLNIPSGDPVVTALAIHITTQAWEYSLGIISFIYLNLTDKGKKIAEFADKNKSGL